MTTRGSQRREPNTQPARQETTTTALRAVSLPDALSVRDTADRLNVSGVEVIKTLLKNGVTANINQTIDFATAALVAKEYGFEATPEARGRVIEGLRKRLRAEEEDPNVRTRPPVVAVMGHVDHGKTSLLDAIRSTEVTAGEAGGITQHIGAYQVDVEHQKITFLDTPGHEAFTAMRAHGAHVTDVAVIVVAADDGIMPQTIEAIDHAKAAGVPVIVAINKIDRPDADQERVKRQLSEHSLLVEDWGGDTISVGVSARTKEGIPGLLENILLVAEIEELKANPNRRAEGTVIEAQMDPQRGSLATLLVQTGTLRVGDVVVVGESYGRIKAMYDDHNHQIRRAEPAAPAKILGLSVLPSPGEIFKVMPDERTARTIAQERIRERQMGENNPQNALSLQDFYTKAQGGQVKELNLVLKTDVQGSIEPIQTSLQRIGDEKMRVNVLHAAAGSVTEADVLLALASKGIILSFNSHPEPGARRLADVEHVEIRSYNVIYTLVEDVEKALTGMLEPTIVEVVDGRAAVRQLFPMGRQKMVVGCAVTEGKLLRNDSVRVIRQRNILATDKVDSLKRFKDDVREVATGFECGVSLESFQQFQEGDVLEFFHTEVG